MSRPVYRRGSLYARRTCRLLYLAVHPELDGEQNRYVRSLVRSLREKLTPREIQCMEGYYLNKLALVDLAARLEINPSTVSRNIHRGQEKLDQLVRLAEEISPISFSQSA